MDKLLHILPFIDEEEVKELAIKIINKEISGVSLNVLYPFLDDDDLDEIIELLIEKNCGKELTSILPFASKKNVNRIYDSIKSGEIKDINEYSLYPFLGSDKLKEMFNILVKKASEEAKSSNEEDLEPEKE